MTGKEFAALATSAGNASPSAIASLCRVTVHDAAGWLKRGAPAWAVGVMVAARVFGAENIEAEEVARVRAFCEAR